MEIKNYAGRFNQYEITNAIIQLPTDELNISHNSKYVLIVLSSFLNIENFPRGSCLLSNSLIQELTGFGRNKTENSIRELKNEDLLTRTPHTFINYINIEKIMDKHSEFIEYKNFNSNTPY